MPAIAVPQLTTISTDIGFAPDDIISVGDSFEKEFLHQDADDCTPADFTGYTPAFEILDGSGAVLETGVVVPSPGDATGLFTATLTTAQTTTLGDGTFAYRLTITFGAVRKTIWCGNFKVTLCKAPA